MNISLFENLYNAYVKRHYKKTKQTCQQEVNILWKQAKIKFTGKNAFEDHINQKIEKLKKDTMQRKAQTICLLSHGR